MQTNTHFPGISVEYAKKHVAEMRVEREKFKLSGDSRAAFAATLNVIVWEDLIALGCINLPHPTPQAEVVKVTVEEMHNVLNTTGWMFEQSMPLKGAPYHHPLTEITMRQAMLLGTALGIWPNRGTR